MLAALLLTRLARHYGLQTHELMNGMDIICLLDEWFSIFLIDDLKTILSSFSYALLFAIYSCTIFLLARFALGAKFFILDCPDHENVV